MDTPNVEIFCNGRSLFTSKNANTYDRRFRKVSIEMPTDTSEGVEDNLVGRLPRRMRRALICAGGGPAAGDNAKPRAEAALSLSVDGLKRSGKFVCDVRYATAVRNLMERLFV
ncbi:hypothetical protein EVAR_87602_1 [Eumeta japonica]|uniref:Uncharacterized protein n=1 Tax=Eumeta variegata TaxID=151549 RepID=A0A4C1WQ34_EUMVA|nr:hypothetical protein EVAR_87602_1 [Eumeta japonica]